MELREYVRACRRRWPWLVVPVLIAMAVAAGVTLAGGPSHRSSVTLFVTIGAGDPDAKASRLNSYVTLLTGPRVAGAVKAQLGLPLTVDEVRERITAELQEGTDLLVVSATDPSAERSRRMVATATEQLVALARELDPPATGTATGTGTGTATGTGTDAASPASIRIAQDIVTDREPSGLGSTTAFAALLGLLVGAAAVAIGEATRKTVADEGDLRRLGLGTVGVIALGGRGKGGYPGEALAEAFRRLRSLLPAEAITPGDGGRSLLLTGSNPDEGTTAVACGLAIAMAETGSSVVLVDANLRTPGIGRYLSLDTDRGLTDVLSGRAGLDDALQKSLDGRLTVLPSGHHPPDPGELLATPALATTLRNLTRRFDVVLVDAPPLHSVADATVLSKVTDGALLVVRSGRTRTADVERSMDLLQRVGAQLLGAVLNALPRRLPAAPALPYESSDPELVSDLLEGWPEGPAEVGEVEDVAGDMPVRGQARVVDVARARGRARVVTITDLPATPNLPVQRDPHRQPGAQSGE